MATGINLAANLDARAIVILVVVILILVMGFDIDNLLGRER